MNAEKCDWSGCRPLRPRLSALIRGSHRPAPARESFHAPAAARLAICEGGSATLRYLSFEPPKPGRRLSMKYESTVPYVPERIHAAAMYCSDGRVGEHFDDFLTNSLK